MSLTGFFEVGMTFAAVEEHEVLGAPELDRTRRAESFERCTRAHRHPEWESRLRTARAQLRAIKLEQLWTRAAMHGFELPFPEEQSVAFLVDLIERVARLETLFALEALPESVPA